MTEKLKQEVNPLSAVVRQVAQICPAAVQNGKIDFERLRTEWSADLNEPDVESYNFTWVGKNAAIAEANKKIRKTLRPVKADSKDWENTQNLYIEGDNLDVLKLLQESYLGKVKMIYIDPPYNTGNDFVYCDDFTLGCEEYIEKKGQCDIETNERLFRNTETNGRFHSDWCSMIYPRLKIARDLLSDDGVIFISIDDNEQANLKKICDEVFGESNFVALLTIENNPKGRKNSKYISGNSEYCFIYAKNTSDTSSYFIENIPKADLQKDDDGKFFTPGKRVLVGKSSNMYVSNLESEKHYSVYYNKELNDIKFYQEKDCCEQNTDLIHKGYKRYISQLNNKFLENTYTKSTLQNLFDHNALIFKKDTIYEKDFNVFSRMKSLIINDVNKNIDLKTETANSVLEDMGIPFPNSKNVKYIKLLCSLMPEKSFVILDFFSGSATTAHAVMQLNAEDGGNRKFIMVQLPEATDEKSEAYKAGYKNICEIGKERIRRAGDKIMSEHPDAKIDTGFRVFRLDDTNMKDVYYKPVDTAQDSLLDMVDNIKPDRTDMDLLFGAMLERGLMLDMPVEEVQSNGITYYVVNNGDLIACFAENIPESVIHEIANRRPLQALFRDSSFAESKDKINLTEIFKNVDSNIKVCVL